MKHIALYFGMVAALVASCSTQEKDFQTPQQDDVIFYASFEQPADEGTRVYANEDLLLRWTADDRVSIFNKLTYNQQYRFTGETGDNAGGFRKVDTDEFVTGNPITNVVSVYPYQETTKITESEVLTLTLPAEQHYAENTFGLGANTMVSVSEDNVLQYKNVGGYLRISLYGEGVSVSSITLEGNDGEKLAGKALVTMPLDGVPSAVLANDASDAITLVCDSPIALGATAEESVDFWFVVPPITFSKGFTVSITQANGGVFEKATSKSIVVGRSNMTKMSPMRVEKVIPPDRVIYYTSLDGKIVSPSSIAFFGASIISNEYVDGRGILIFDGIVTSIGIASFLGCSKLTSIDIPNSVTSIGANSFLDCSGLTSIVIPNSVTSIGEDAFCWSGLHSLVIPESVTRIESEAFRECINLTSITIPEGVTSIEYCTFCGCTSLTSLVIPNSVTSIGEGSFADCSGLTTIDIPNSVTSIGKYSFSGCSGLTSITVLSVTPPVGNTNMFASTNDCPIYVPAASVEAYKSAEFWRDYADRIQAIMPEAVDLGLPSGLKWASFNLGASKPEEYGDYYAWGETEPKDEYSWNNYKYYLNDPTGKNDYVIASEMTKYNSTDKLTVLDPLDDAASVTFGEDWRMPTVEEWEELSNAENCSWTWITQNGVSGYRVTSLIPGYTNMFIFLPAAGAYSGSTGTQGRYWSSSLDTTHTLNYAWMLSFSSSSFINTDYGYRKNGYSVRPVCVE